MGHKLYECTDLRHNQLETHSTVFDQLKTDSGKVHKIQRTFHEHVYLDYKINCKCMLVYLLNIYYMYKLTLQFSMFVVLFEDP